MPLNKAAKESAVAELAERLTRAKAALVFDYHGLKVESVNEIRRGFRAAGIEYKVVKNTLMQRALAATPLAKLGAAFKNTTAVAFKYDDEFGKLGRTAKDLVKKFEKLKPKGGFVDKDVLPDARAMDVIAGLPTRDEARAQLLGVLNAPASQLLGVLNAPASQLLGVLEEKSKKDEEKNAPAAAAQAPQA